MKYFEENLAVVDLGSVPGYGRGMAKSPQHNFPGPRSWHDEIGRLVKEADVEKRWAYIAALDYLIANVSRDGIIDMMQVLSKYAREQLESVPLGRLLLVARRIEDQWKSALDDAAPEGPPRGGAGRRGKKPAVPG